MEHVDIGAPGRLFEFIGDTAFWLKILAED
jgi:hypothetical protein